MKRLTDKQEQYIRANYMNQSWQQMADALKISKSGVASCMRRNGLKVSEEIKEARKQAAIQARYDKRHATKQPGDRVIKKAYLTTPVKAIAIKIGRSYCYVNRRLKELGLEIPAEQVERNRQAGRIKTGNVPKNKGKKAEEYMTPEALEKLRKTAFKKGNKPHNTAEKDGVISVRADKSGRKYKHVRVAMSKWELLHRVVWEKENGKVPEGMMVTFIDGDSLNCELSNLKLISMKDNVLRNSASLNLTDMYVATTIVGARGRPDRALIETLAQDKELIEVKRLELQIKRTIKNRIENGKQHQ